MKRIIDVCCGSKMFWFNKDNPDVLFCDNRLMEHKEFSPGRYIDVKPDTVCDFTALPFADDTFYLAVFDPPHLLHAGEKSWLAIKYGRLESNWEEVLRKGFAECLRVLKPNGILIIFKWSEVDIPIKKALSLCPIKPLFGNRSGRNNQTHWICYMK